MLTENMFFTKEKLKRNIEKLEVLRYREHMEIPVFEKSEESFGRNGERPEEISFPYEFKKGDFWQGRGNYLWIRQKVAVPASWAGRKIAGIFNFGKTGDGYNSGFEGLLYLDGAPYTGIGSWHEEVIFPAEIAGKEITLSIRLWAGLEGGGEPVVQIHQFKQAELCILDETADDFYYTSRAMLETAEQLTEKDAVGSALLRALDRAHLAVDWRAQGSEAFYTSLEKALSIAKEEMKTCGQPMPVTVHTVGHSHIDVAWLWQLKHTREKAARTFSTALTLMEQYPEFVFLQSQPQLYKYIKADYPDIYERIKKAVAAGNWEPNGGMWVESDCNIVSGESLVRQFLKGREFFQKEFGAVSNALWLPDVFGYSWALPQILKKSGIDVFMTIKISWNQYNQMPHDTFMWRGIDGTEVLTHFMSTPSIDDCGGYTYNGKIDPKSVMGAWNLYHDKEVNNDLLLAYGHGDGGGGVNRDMLEMGRHLREMPGHPTVVPGKAGEYFDRLVERVKDTDRYVHTWDGELYLEYHRGTYTSQARNKRYNRKTELLLRETEWLSTMASAKKNSWDAYEKEQLDSAWEILLRNQFHDIIPGSSIHEVYEDSREEYEQALEILNGVKGRALEVLAGDSAEDRAVIVNSSSFDRNDLAFVEDTRELGAGTWYDGDGNALKTVREEAGWLVDAGLVKANSLKNIYFRKDDVSESFLAGDFAGEADTPYYHVVWNEKGQMVSLYDKENSREVIPEGSVGNQFVVYEDRPLRFDAWDIDLFYKEKAYEVEELQSATVETSALRTDVKMTWKYQNSVIQQEIRFYHNDRRIDFVTNVDWNEHQQLLKVLFPVDVRSTEAVFDIQYGNVKRPTHGNTSWDMAKFEMVGHQWADISETGYGVSLMNDCKYGYSAFDNVLGLSLIKSGVYPDTQADQGAHTFTYALYPHSGSWQEAGVAKSAWHLNNPLYAVWGSIETESTFCRASVENVMIDSVKKAENGEEIIIRIHEYEGMRNHCALETGFKVQAWREVNLMEEASGEWQTGELAFTVKPYEIKTFAVRTEK